MADKSLQIKISALIEGMKEVEALGKKFLEVANHAKALAAIGDPFQPVKRGATEAANAIDQAFSSLGGRSLASLREEVDKVNKALQAVKASGASFDDVTRATTLAEARIAALNREMTNPAPKTLGDSLNSIADKLRKLNFKGAADEAKSLGGAFDLLKGLIGPVIAGFIALTGLKSLSSLVKESADLASKVETLGVTLNVVGRNAGYSTDELSKQEAGLKKLGITTESARESLSNMIQAGIQINAVSDQINSAGERMTKAQELARAAQDLAVVSGENSSDTLKRLVTNIQQMDSMGLRFMGLTVDRSAAESEFALQVGKSATALSESEKKQAFLNATMKESRKLSGAYVDALETVSKKLGSLKRYQDEFMLSIGNNFVPAYGSLVDAVTNYLKEGQKVAEQFEKTKVASSGFKDGMKALADSIGGALLNSTTGALTALDSFSRAFRGLGELLGPLIEGIGAVLPGVLFLIKGLFDGIAVLAAFIKDTVLLVFANWLAGWGALATGMSVVIGKVAALAELLHLPFAKSLRAISDDLAATGRDMSGFGREVIEGVEGPNGAVNKLASSFSEASKAAAATKAEVLKFSAEINELSKRQASGTISTEELNAKYQALAASLDAAKTAGSLTKKEFTDLNKQLDAVPGTLASAFKEASTSAGLSFQQVTQDISKESAAGAEFLTKAANLASLKTEEAFGVMGTSATEFGQATLGAFAKFAEGSKTIGDVTKLIDSLREAKNKGVISETVYNEALDITAKKFDAVLEAQLKTINTKAGFERLESAVRNLGNSGAISGTQQEAAFKKIEEALNGATGATKKLIEAQRGLTVADQSVAIAQARYDLAKSESDVASARVKIWVSENSLHKDYNALTLLGVEQAKINLVVAEDGVKVSRLRYQEEIAQMDMVIAKQREQIANEVLRQQPRNEQAQKDVALAKEQQVSADLLLTSLKIQIDTQRELGIENQITKLKIDEQVSATKEMAAATADATKEAGSHSSAIYTAATAAKALTQEIGASTTATQGAQTALQGLKTEVDTVTLALGASGLQGAQTQVSSGYGNMATSSSQWANSAISDAARVSAAYNAANSARTSNKPDVKGDFAPGNGSITNPETGEVVNLPKDTAPGKGKSAMPPKGKPFKNEVDQTGAPQLNDQDKEALRELGMSMGTIDRPEHTSGNDMKAMDNSGMFIAWEKFMSGELTKGDEALVKSVWKVAKFNLDQAANSKMGGWEGKQDATMWFIRARTMMERLNLPQLKTGTNYVPKDMLALLHEGEEVVPKEYNPNAGGSRPDSDTSVKLGSIRDAIGTIMSPIVAMGQSMLGNGGSGSGGGWGSGNSGGFGSKPSGGGGWGSGNEGGWGSGGNGGSGSGKWNPSKVIQLDLNFGGSVIPAFVQQDSTAQLLKALGQARSTS